MKRLKVPSVQIDVDTKSDLLGSKLAQTSKNSITPKNRCVVDCSQILNGFCSVISTLVLGQMRYLKMTRISDPCHELGLTVRLRLAARLTLIKCSLVVSFLNLPQRPDN